MYTLLDSPYIKFAICITEKPLEYTSVTQAQSSGISDGLSSKLFIQIPGLVKSLKDVADILLFQLALFCKLLFGRFSA